MDDSQSKLWQRNAEKKNMEFTLRSRSSTELCLWLQNPLDCSHIELLWHGSGHDLTFLSVLEEQNHGHGLDFVVLSNLRVVVCVYHKAFEPPSVLHGDLINYPMNHPAWTAPARIELYKDRCFAVQNFFLPRALGNDRSCTNQIWNS